MTNRPTVTGVTLGGAIGLCADCMEAPYSEILDLASELTLLLDEGQTSTAQAETLEDRTKAAATTKLPPPRVLTGIVDYSKLLHGLSGEVRRHPAVEDAHTVVLLTDTDQPDTYKHWKHSGPLW